MFVNYGSVHMCCQHVAGVVGPSGFLKSKNASANLDLHPEIGSGEMPNLPESTATRDADSGALASDKIHRESRMPRSRAMG